MEKLKFRPLKESEIEVRIGMARPNGVSLLLYKNARCDMSILDETVGVENWQRKHYDCKNNLYCSVGIKCSDGWVWKDDCGSESNQDKEKGEASDAFKRACVNWGIGRELYTAPFIWICPPNCKIEGNKCRDKFKVRHIAYNDGHISELTIVRVDRSKETVVFELSQNAAPTKQTQPTQAPPPKQTQPAQAPPRAQELICPKCGKPIMGYTGKSGQIHSADEVFTNYKMCLGCVKKMKETKND